MNIISMTDITLAPNLADIRAHLTALFAPGFVHSYPDAWIEIAFGHPDIRGGSVDQAQNYSAFDLDGAASFAAAKTTAGFNVYAGVALRHGKEPREGRATIDHYLTSAFAWAEFDGAGDFERIKAILQQHGLKPALVVVTGTVPHKRAHVYFKISGIRDAEHLKAINTALQRLLGSDPVSDPCRVLRLAGTINHPSQKKQARGYVSELTTLLEDKSAPTYRADELSQKAGVTSVTPAKTAADYFEEFGRANSRRDDGELQALLDSIAAGNWHNPMRDAVAMMVGRGWPDDAIRLACARYCDDGADDPDLTVLIDGARRKWDTPEPEPDKSGQPAAKTAAPRALPLTYFGEFGDQTKKRPILKGFVNKGETSAVIAAPKRGKSAFMTEIAIHCAAGKDWRGHTARERCGVVIFAIERAHQYRQRLDAHALRDGHKALPIAVVGKVIDLLSPKCVEIIVATVREAEQHFGCAVGLIAFDTYSKGIAAGGGDENSATDQNKAAANLRRVQEMIDVHVACVGHTGKDETRGARGSNAHLGDVDVMIQITGDDRTKTAKVTAANDQPERVLAQFRLELAETGKADEDGEVETTSILAADAVSSPDTGEAGKLSDIQQAALNEIWECIADGETARRPENVHVPVGVTGLTLTTWRKRLAARRIINPEGNPHEQFKRIHVSLSKRKKIAIWEEFVWPIT